MTEYLTTSITDMYITDNRLDAKCKKTEIMQDLKNSDRINKKVPKRAY